MPWLLQAQGTSTVSYAIHPHTLNHAGHELCLQALHISVMMQPGSQCWLQRLPVHRCTKAPLGGQMALNSFIRGRSGKARGEEVLTSSCS